MGLATGGIISLGGGSSGSGSSGSGIISVNSQLGPAISITGVNGIDISAGGNVITVNGAALSGLIGMGGSTSGNSCYTTTFTNVLEQTFTHSLGTKSIIVQIQDLNDEFISADLITAIDINNVKVRFNTAQDGLLTVVSCGSSPLTPSGVSKFAASFFNITSGIFTHGLNTRDVLVQIYDNSGPPRKIMNDDIILDDLDHLSLIFNSFQSGRVVILG